MEETAETPTPDTQLFCDVFNASPIGIAVETLEGQPLFVNPALCAILGFSEEELRSKHCVDFSPPEDAEKDWALFQQLRAGSIDHYQLEKRYFRRDGSLVWGNLSMSLLSSRPSPLVLAMVEDITEKKMAEEARFRHAAIVESSEDAIASVTLDGVIDNWNAGAGRIYGYTEAEAVGKSVTILVPPELPDEENKILETLRAGGHIEHFERVGVTKTGKRINVSLSISPIKGSAGETVGCSVIARDITEQKRAQEALHKSEERFRLAAQAGKMYAYQWDVATDAIVRSGDVSGVLGLTDEASVTRQQLLARVHPDDRAIFNASITERTPEHPDVQISYRLLRPDGSLVWVEKTAHALFDKGGRLVRMIGMVADITERKRAEDATRESEMRYRRIVETANEGVWLLDSRLRTSYLNRQMAEMLGYEPAEMVGRSVFDFYFPEDVEHKKQVLGRRQQGLREQLEERLRRRDGSELWVRVAATPVFKDSGEFDGALAMVCDITERKRAEETLRESEEKFRNVFRDAGVGMVIVSPEGRFLAANKAFCDCLGYTEQELLPKTVESVTLSEDWPAFSQKLREALTDGRGFQWFEKRCLHKSGRIVYTESSASVIRSRGGVPQYFVGQVLDITKRKQAERALSDMSRKLVEAQEHERARIARELHDDINQRLALLAIELEQLQGDPSEVRSRVQELRKQTIEISNGVQALSHDLHSSQLEYLGVVAGMKSWCKEFGERQGMQIDCSPDVQGTLPAEIGLCLFRVLQEAVHNAAKHSGVKRIEVRLHEESDEIHLIIRDWGKGFDMEAAKQGRGLGLTSMQERVRLVHGTIVIDSKPMGGTTIHVRVPFRSERFSERAAG
ncbi:MAG TPA: PAS domain S-box protein [Terriglobales bacterium]|nr:PAS domain S-box protein [Terriglobales bacterium]